ncbi:MAG: DUF4296 domain-containing protein [Chitinophagaceae bacterium]
MRFLFLICVCTGFLFPACSRKDEIPPGVMPAPRMTEVLFDVMRADQFLASFVFSRDTSSNKRKESIKLYRDIFRSHHTTREEFQQSINYYLAHPRQFRSILDSISAKKQETPPAPEIVPQPEVITKDTLAGKDSVTKRRKGIPLEVN